MNDAERAEIERACERLARAYANHIDFGEYDAFANLFAEDAVLHTGVRVEGKKAIREKMASRPSTLRSRHVITNQLVEVIDKTHAKGVAYLTLFRSIDERAQDPDKPLPLTGVAGVGHYTDEYIKTDAGWRFQSRVLTFAFLDESAFP